MKTLFSLLLALAFAAPALAEDGARPGFGYPAGFGYQTAPSPGSGRSFHDHGYRDRDRHRGRRPEREVTTITPLENGGTRIETRRYDDARGITKFRPDDPHR